MKAFPQGTTNSGGMELRDYFATRVMQSFLSQQKTLDAISENRITVDKLAENCYNMADLMMEARKQK